MAVSESGSLVMGRNSTIEVGKPKKSYSQPVLTTYGHMAKLTAAGTSGVAEGSSSAPSKLKP